MSADPVQPDEDAFTPADQPAPAQGQCVATVTTTAQCVPEAVV